MGSLGLSGEQWAGAVRAAIVLVIGLGLAWLIHRRVARLRPFGAPQALLIRRIASSAVLVVSIIWALNELGFELGPLLGAAGILTVAVGFAAQTSMSNLISGIFLLGERPFVVGDFITVGDKSGEVVAIDVMSIKVRTFDNLLLRIPNETMLKSNVINITHFPIRRADIQLSVAYKEDLETVCALLESVANENLRCLQEPEPVIIFTGFGDSGVNLQFSVWGAREDFIAFRNSMYVEIKRALDEAGIEIPFPHRSLYAGSETGPLPVRVVGR